MVGHLFSLFIAISLLITFSSVTDARIPDVYTGGTRQSAHTTFYDVGSDAFGTMATKHGYELIESNFVEIPANCKYWGCIDPKKCDQGCKASGFQNGKCWGALRDPPKDLFCCCH